ncbi:MAG: DUF418 domain-containing protein [Opitutales bacterium]|nr:DUF418 domain-containing protein [Opitutales bacterium]
MASPLSPTAPSDRIEFLDILRGFALFGILVVNIPYMAAPFSALLAGRPLFQDPLNLFAHGFIRFFFEGSFYVLFSFLFGVGLHLFFKRARAAGVSGGGRYARRLGILALFGILHITLLWYGDILLVYAIFGSFVLLLRQRRSRTLLYWAGGLASIPVLATAALAGLLALGQAHPESAAEIAAVLAAQEAELLRATTEALLVYAYGTFPEIVAVRLSEYAGTLPGFIFFFPVVPAMMLLGIVFGRKGWLSDLRAHAPLYQRGLLYCLPVALLGKGLYVWASFHSTQLFPTGISVLGTLALVLGGPASAFVYLCLLRHALLAAPRHPLLRHLAATGRLALTHYILQSIILTTLLYSYGFALYGRLDIKTGLLLALLLFSLQLLLSPLWLTRFPRGPLEALWRRLTY